MSIRGNQDFKRLPRKKDDPTLFWAIHNFATRIEGKSGKIYHLRTPDQGIGMFRVSELLKLSTSAGFGIPLAEVRNNARKASQCLEDFQRGEYKLQEAFAILGSMELGANRDFRLKYNIALGVATLFIVAEDEDLLTWSLEDQEEKINDLDHYNEADFFFLAINAPEWFLNSYNSTLQTLTK